MTSTRIGLAAVPAEPSDLLLSIDLARGLIIGRGELDRAHAHRLEEAVGLLQGSSAAQWSIDVAEISFCDVVGLRSLLAANSIAVRSGHRLVITRPSRMLARLLAWVGPDAGLNVVTGDRCGRGGGGVRPR